MTWEDVGRALIGSWPSQVASWGKDAIQAYVDEIQARGVTPDRALVAIRCCTGSFPPSAGELAAQARKDPDQPTADELLAQLYGPGGAFGFKRSGVTVSPWVLAFVESYGRERLRMLEVDDPKDGKWRRRELMESWERFLEANEGRQVHEIARRSSGLSQLDPLATVGRRELEAGRS